MTFRPFLNVIVCRLVPGSEEIVGSVFAHYDKITRPQDLGVIGRLLLSHGDLYLHVLERKADPAISGQRRGLPAFEQIAKEIGPYVTPYPSYWENPSQSVATPFYSWVPEGEVAADRELTVIIRHIRPGSQAEVARIFAESDAGSLPADTGVTGRWLFTIDDLFVHLLEQDREAAAAVRRDYEGHRPAFAAIMAALDPFLSEYSPDAGPAELGPVARVFYRWQADDWVPAEVVSTSA